MFPFLQPQHRNHTTRNLPMFSNRVRNHPPEYIGHCWQMTLWNLGATNDEAGSSTLSWTSWHGHAVVSKLPARRLWIYDLIVSPPGFEFPRCRTSCNCQQSMARSAQSLQLVVQTAVTRSDGVVERPVEPTRRGIGTMPALRFVFRRRYRASCFATLELCLAHTSVSYDPPSFYHPGRVSPHIRLIKAVCPSQHDPSTTISPPVTSRLPSGVDAKPR
jgi:hypothetical protein